MSTTARIPPVCRILPLVAALTLADPALGDPEAALRANPVTPSRPAAVRPTVDASAYLDPLSSVIGDVSVGRRVYVAPFASLRGDEGHPIRVGDESNVQDGVVLHALETERDGAPIPKRSYDVDGENWAVYIADRVSLAHQSQVHGPAWIEDDTFVGMQALVFNAHIGSGVVIEPGAKVIGVTIPPGRYVRAGAVLTDQQAADALPSITESYPFRDINKNVVRVNTGLADGYGKRDASSSH